MFQEKLKVTQTRITCPAATGMDAGSCLLVSGASPDAAWLVEQASGETDAKRYRKLVVTRPMPEF